MRRHLLFGALADKDVTGMLDALAPSFADIVLTQSSSPRAISVEDLARIADELRIPFTCYDCVEDALIGCLPGSEPDDVWAVAGSLTVVAETRRFLEAEE